MPGSNTKKQTIGILSVLANLPDLADRADAQGINREVLEFCNLLINQWIATQNHTDFEQLLRLLVQKEKISKRRFGLLSEREASLYSLGMLSGVECMIKELYIAEAREQQIDAVCSKSKQVLRILECLYNNPMLDHADLAAAARLSNEDLVGYMKGLLQCRAVSASGTCSGTRYSLTPAGARYWKKNRVGLEDKGT